ncbi:MAG: hypothetical protein PHQ54_02600 [Candidatus Omnitrophica bacterium]|nr:hypothetical protein [Candidatus Omnitrophota bacterium]
MKRIFAYICCAFLMLELSGCAGLSKKFVRKKKQEEKPPVILALEEDKDIADYHELYKKHFMLWQYWHDELISALKQNYKKQKECAAYTYEHLNHLRKYVFEDRRASLDSYISQMEQITAKINDRRISDTTKIRIAGDLEKLKRLIDKEYRYPQIKDYIVVPKAGN